MKKYIVTLTDDERQSLSALVSSGKAAAKRITHARILLKADAADEGPAWRDADIALALDIDVRAVERVRGRFVGRGPEAALARKPRCRLSRPPVFDGDAEARLIALACSRPPEGRARWTPRMLADRPVELEVVEAVSHETVRRTLRETRGSRTWSSRGASRRSRTRNSSARWGRTRGLRAALRPRPPGGPPRRGERATHRRGEDAGPGRPGRFDHEYVRNGTVNLFVVNQPLVGCRYVEVTQRRTAVDSARRPKVISDDLYSGAEKIVRVTDDRNTHELASLYEAFEPAEARRLVERFEVHPTPKHGPWLNMAEIELAVLPGQGLGQRFENREAMERAAEAWPLERNERRVGVNWRSTTEDARIELERLYPVIRH